MTKNIRIDSLIRVKLKNKDKSEIVKLMGYSSESQGIKTLDNLLSKGFYDFLKKGIYDLSIQQNRLSGNYVRFWRLIVN